jgi:hypothetical protein
MNWNAVGAVGQILGSLATFVTVGYLVIQVHDTEREMQRSLVQSRTQQNIAPNMGVASNDHFVAVRVKANNVLLGNSQGWTPFIEAAINKFELSPEEAWMLGAQMTSEMANVAQSILYADELPPPDRFQLDSSIRRTMAEPVRRFYYDMQKSRFNPVAVRYIDNLMAQPQ